MGGMAMKSMHRVLTTVPFARPLTRLLICLLRTARFARFARSALLTLLPHSTAIVYFLPPLLAPVVIHGKLFFANEMNKMR